MGLNTFSETNSTKAIIKNVYSIDDIYGENNNSIIEQSSVKTPEELKLIVLVLGSAFKEDKSNMNSGYPLLSWQ